MMDQVRNQMVRIKELIKDKTKNWSKKEIAILSVIIVVILTAFCALFFLIREYTVGSQVYHELEPYVFLPEEPDPAQTPGTSPSPEEKEFVLAPPPTVDFDSLKALNSDCIGWIYLQDSPINYPLVQGADNAYYQTHTFDKAENKNGAIFLDVLNNKDLSDENSLFYGHHMKNGAMFASLVDYTEQSYYDAHPAYWIVTPEKTYRVDVFAGFLTDTESNVWQLTFASEEDFQTWLKSMVRKSYFKSNVVPTIEDHIITLATCSYETDDSRYVVMGILNEYEPSK